MPLNRSITRRTIAAGLLAAGGVAIWVRQIRRKPTLASDLGEMLMLGFTGNTADSNSARILAAHVAAGRVGSVVFRKMNVGSRQDVADLVRLVAPRGSNPLVAIDHEGGSVQRLAGEGFTQLPSARQVAMTYSPEEAGRLYAEAATEFAAAGFNLNLAPVVDLDDPYSPAIGRFGRAFDRNPVRVAAFAAAFIDAFALSGVHCALKHFPGEGLAEEDSHENLPDVTATWSVEELDPYVRLIASGRARIIMSGHMRLKTLEPKGVPTTFSAAVTTGLLRGKLGFHGVAMTDDLDMKAISGRTGRRDAVIRAIAAGNDLLMVCNTENFDPELPQNILEWVEEALAKGLLAPARIAEAAERVRALKQFVHDGNS